jgi:hypothetical protein
MADSFDGNIEKDSFASQPATGRTVFEMCQNVKFKLGKKSKGDVDDNSKRGRKESETTENIDVPFKDHEKRVKKIEASIPKSEKPWLRIDCEGRIVKG